MKRNLTPLLFLFLIILSGKVIAQNYTMTAGTPFTPSKDGPWYDYIGDNDKSFFVLQKHSKGKDINYFIEKYDKKTQKLEWTADTKFSDLNWEVNIMYMGDLLRTVLTDDKIFVFVKYFDKEAQEAKCLMKTISLDGKDLDTYKQIATMHSDAFGITGRNYYYVLSPDKSKLLLMAEFEWPKKASDTHLTLYDTKTFQPIWEKELPNGYENSTISTYNYRLDNSGSFTFFFRYRLSSENEDLGTCMGLLSNKSKEAKIIEIKPEAGKEVYNAAFQQTKDGKFLYTGIYKDVFDKKEKKNRKAGIFTYLINADGKIESSEFNPFPDDVEQKLHYDMGMVEAPTGQKLYSISNLKEMNGSYYLFANHAYALSNGSVSTTYEREFIITKINDKGKAQWTKIFPKATFDRLNTYNIIMRNNKIYLFYMENPKNLETFTLDNYDPKKYKEIGKYNGSTFVGLEISEDGTANRKVIMENDGWCYDPESYNILIDKDNGLLLRMIYDKSQKGRDKKSENDGMERYDVLRIE